MKVSYSISYLFSILCLSFLLVIAYNHSYNEQHKNGYNEISKVDGESINNQMPLVSSGFYLRVHGDYVIVYLYDNVTVFEETNIRMDELNEELQFEIINGKYLEDTRSLYGFLENYTS